jgi:hypothetical protein
MSGASIRIALTEVNLNFPRESVAAIMLFVLASVILTPLRGPPPVFVTVPVMFTAVAAKVRLIPHSIPNPMELILFISTLPFIIKCIKLKHYPQINHITLL